MKKIILSISVAAFAVVAAQAGSDSACCAAKQEAAKADSDGACCAVKQVAGQAKAQCPMAAKQAKLNAKNSKQVVTKQQLKSPKAVADVRG